MPNERKERSTVNRIGSILSETLDPCSCPIPIPIRRQGFLSNVKEVSNAIALLPPPSILLRLLPIDHPHHLCDLLQLLNHNRHHRVQQIRWLSARQRETLNVMENDVLRPMFLKAQMESKQEGEQIGETKMLTRLLQRRFGNVPTWASEKIAKAELPFLEEWSLRFVDAKTLDEVFADQA